MEKYQKIFNEAINSKVLQLHNINMNHLIHVDEFEYIADEFGEDAKEIKDTLKEIEKQSQIFGEEKFGNAIKSKYPYIYFFEDNQFGINYIITSKISNLFKILEV